MYLDEWIMELWDNPKFQEKMFTAIWVISLGMVVLGYLLIIYFLFFH